MKIYPLVGAFTLQKYIQYRCHLKFQDYFEAADPATDLQPATVSSVAVYKDPLDAAGGQRSINKVLYWLYCTVL